MMLHCFSVHMSRHEYLPQRVNYIAICQNNLSRPFNLVVIRFFSLSLSCSGHTPVTVTGTNLDIIQTPLIRAKYNNHETLNVSCCKHFFQEKKT